MEFPNMRKDWDSRFIGIDMRKQFVAFCEDYIGEVQEEYAGRIESMKGL